MQQRSARLMMRQIVMIEQLSLCYLHKKAIPNQVVEALVAVGRVVKAPP
jgi:hypothetical protein